MSSLRNSLHRRNHKERSQLSHRSRLGVLEKHKDYVQRARDFHSKRDRIKRLREKAADRNKDEFYFGMVKSKTEGGVHVKDRGNTSLPTDMVKVLKSQDGNYIRAVRQAGLKKIDKLKLQLTSLADLTTPGRVGDDDLGGSDDEDPLNEEDLDVLREAGVLAPSKGKGKERRKSAGSRKKQSTGSRGKHVVFVSNEEEARKYQPPQAGSAQSPRAHDSQHDAPADLGWEWPESKRARQKAKRSSEVDPEEEKTQKSLDVEERKQAAATHRRHLLKELAARLKRDLNLRYAGRELEMQKLMMGKGAAKKIRGVEQVEGEDRESEDDEDALDARKGKRRKVDVGMEEKPYKPRVYKWRAERKR